jgi:hypothetical protein
MSVFWVSGLESILFPEHIGRSRLWLEAPFEVGAGN